VSNKPRHPTGVDIQNPEEAEIEILRKDYVEVRRPDGEMEPRTYITYRDEQGRLDMIIIHVKEPTDEEIATAILKRREAQEKIRPYKIPIRSE